MFRQLNLTPALVVLLSAVYTGLFAPSVSASPFYKYDVIAATGQNNIVDIGWNLSINDGGNVAFVGQLTSGGYGIFVGQEAGKSILINPAASLNASRRVSNAVQINNQNRVVSQDQVPGNPPANRVRVWDATKTDSSTLIASGGFAVFPQLRPDYDGVFAFPSINNTYPVSLLEINHGVVFIALDGPDTLLAVPQSPVPGFRFYEAKVGTPVRPLIADDGSVVVSFAGGGPIRLYDNSLGDNYIVIADGSMGFSELGRSPGISDDGKVVAFYGVLNNAGASNFKLSAGPGIFASIDEGQKDANRNPVRRLIRITDPEVTVEDVSAPGGNDDGICDPGETCKQVRKAELGYDDAGKPIGFDVMGFDPDSRVGVTHISLGADDLDDDCFVVAFLGTPSSASRGNPTLLGQPLFFSKEKGLWTARVDVERELIAPQRRVYHLTGQLPVAQIGDVIAKQAITGITVYDPIANAAFADVLEGSGDLSRTQRRGDHRIAFWATTSNGAMVVRASHLDSDEDGLLDHWETSGIDIDGNGDVDLNLKDMGADPFKRDLFLEIDWLVGRPAGLNPYSRNEPAFGALDDLVKMFGDQGITLHIDAGPGIESIKDQVGKPFSKPFSKNMGKNMETGALHGGDKIEQFDSPGTQIDMVYFGLPNSITEQGVEARSFHEIKDRFFGNTDKRARELSFRYVILADVHSFFMDPKDARKRLKGGVYAGLNPVPLPDGTSSGRLFAIGNPFEDNNGTVTKLFGQVVKITGGTGAGQIRRIVSNDANTLTVEPAWKIIPDGKSTFIVFSGSSGLAEHFFYPAPDNNALPGNDLLVTLYGFGTDYKNPNKGYLGNSYYLWRTLAHEIGHTLGLRHCGIDPDASLCDGVDANGNTVVTEYNTYLSLMSYAHQNTEPARYAAIKVTPVNSYSGSGDPTYIDWPNLKFDFQNTTIRLGNTFGLSFGSEPSPNDPEPTPLDLLRINKAPLDLTDPVAVIDAPIVGSTVAIGDAVTVQVTASDNIGVQSVVIFFDRNGNGNTNDAGEEVLASSQDTGRFQATFSGILGPAGSRIVDVLARDLSGNVAVAERVVMVTTDMAQDADLSISVTDAPNPVAVGGELTYTISVKNSGPSPATGVVVTDTLPSGVSLVSATSTQGSITGTGTINASLVYFPMSYCVMGGSRSHR